MRKHLKIVKLDLAISVEEAEKVNYLLYKLNLPNKAQLIRQLINQKYKKMMKDKKG